MCHFNSVWCLPTDDHTSENLDYYMEVIDSLQCLLESRKSTAPVMIVGDMNTGLPQKPRISLDWYKNGPFSKSSLLLYDFLCENELCVGNFAFN